MLTCLFGECFVILWLCLCFHWFDGLSKTRENICVMLASGSKHAMKWPPCSFHSGSISSGMKQQKPDDNKRFAENGGGEREFLDTYAQKRRAHTQFKCFSSWQGNGDFRSCSFSVHFISPAVRLPTIFFPLRTRVWPSQVVPNQTPVTTSPLTKRWSALRIYDCVTWKCPCRIPVLYLCTVISRL